MSERSVKWFLDSLQEQGVMTIDDLSSTYIFKDGEIDYYTLWRLVKEAGEQCQEPEVGNG